MEVIGILANPQVGMGFQPSELWAMGVDEVLFWGSQLERVAKLMTGNNNG